MVDLETRMKIDALLDYAYDKTIERMNAIESAPHNSVYQTIVMVKDNFSTYIQAYINYYNGCLDGIFSTRFLEEFDRMPSPSEISFIKEAIASKFESLKDAILDLAKQKFKERK